MLSLLFIVIGLAAGSAGGYFYRKLKIEKQNQDLALKAEKVLAEAKDKAKEVLYDAKSEAFKLQDEVKKEEKKMQAEINQIENRLLSKEELLDKKNSEVEKAKQELEQKIEDAKQRKAEVETLQEQQAKKLEEISGMDKVQAKDYLLKKVEEEVKDDIVLQIQKAEAELKEKSDEKAKWIIADAIARCASETTLESTATIVNLPSDDMKGRIIGREGRNINTFEQVTGVDVIVDDTPGSILVSGFDLVRRYVAKVTLERLIEDGRIHPARIEEMYQKVKDEVNDLIKELGEKAMLETGVTGLHPNLVKILGRLKFRVTHGQNALKHSMEVSFIASNLAAELGADISVCRRAGLLHDIGKAVDHEVSGHHAKIGADIARKFGLPEEVAHAIEAHHGSPEPKSLEAKLVQTANIISGARPGANKDNLDTYIRRLSELEALCNGFNGVEKTYAIQAGAELRVFVTPDLVDDLQAVKLSYEIARKVEKDMHHPGPVKVHVVREVRVEDFAT